MCLHTSVPLDVVGDFFDFTQLEHWWFGHSRELLIRFCWIIQFMVWRSLSSSSLVVLQWKNEMGGKNLCLFVIVTFVPIPFIILSLNVLREKILLISTEYIGRLLIVYVTWLCFSAYHYVMSQYTCMCTLIEMYQVYNCLYIFDRMWRKKKILSNCVQNNCSIQAKDKLHYWW